ncbi:gallinacin-3-like [Anser cygnoides]|uniref:gallinacin-3-like n=1 Tax=Anser cygnoides TaxID=8845 RepID=UPI0034D299CD
MFRAKQHSLATGARGHEGFLLGLFVPEHQDLHQLCEDLFRASAMKILFLLFPFFLLFLQGAAEIMAPVESEVEFVVQGAAGSLKGVMGDVHLSFLAAAGHGFDALNSVSRMSPSLLAPGNSS